MPRGRRQREEHERKAEHERQQPEAEHHVDAERDRKEGQALVPAERAQELAHREGHATEVEAHHGDARGLHAHREGKGVAEQVIEQVLRAKERQLVDVGEPVGGVAVVVDETQRRDVEREILQGGVLDDPRRRRGEDGDRDEGERARSRPRQLGERHRRQAPAHFTTKREP